MSATDNFRSSLHGFNRTDVVQFIQQQTATHENAMRSLKEENARLQEALDAARAENERLLMQNESLVLELEAVRMAIVEPQAEPQPEPTPVLDAPIAPVEAVVTTLPSDFNEMELAAYRRAEMTERMARERAASSANRMKMIFTQADEKLTLSAQDISTVYDALRTDYEHLQQILTNIQSVVNESSSGLKAAADICNEP